MLLPDFPGLPHNLKESTAHLLSLVHVTLREAEDRMIAPTASNTAYQYYIKRSEEFPV